MTDHDMSGDGVKISLDALIKTAAIAMRYAGDDASRLFSETRQWASSGENDKDLERRLLHNALTAQRASEAMAHYAQASEAYYTLVTTRLRKSQGETEGWEPFGITLR